MFHVFYVKMIDMVFYIKLQIGINRATPAMS